MAHSVEHPAPSRAPLLAITLSREAGAGAIEVGRLLGDYLQKQRGEEPDSWGLYDHNLVEKVLEDHGLRKEIAEYMPENVKSRFHHTMEELLGVHPSLWTLAQYTAKTIYRLAMAGNAILIGRGANIATAKLQHVFHVRLVAPFAQRVARLASVNALSKEEATALVRDRDEFRARYVRQHFEADITDPLQYHLTVNMGRYTFVEAAKMIGDAALKVAIKT